LRKKEISQSGVMESDLARWISKCHGVQSSIYYLERSYGPCYVFGIASEGIAMPCGKKEGHP
jgi:hypothetical protein